MWILSIILVASLFAFAQLLSYQGINVESWLSRIRSFILYSCLLFLFLLFWHWQRNNKKIWFLAAIWLILLWIVWILGLQYGLQWVLLLLIWAYVEEFIKIWASETTIKKEDFHSSDIITFAVLTALWFSIVENVIYVVLNVILQSDTSIFALFLGRWIFSSSIHMIATGLIALMLFKLYQNTKSTDLPVRKQIGRIVWCMILGVWVHFFYNISLEYDRKWVYWLVVIWGYFLLSYLLFLSDRLYKT